MAIVKISKDGYGQLEINNCAFRRDGREEAQCKLDASFEGVCEVGTLLEVDAGARTVKYATADSVLVGLHYSAEKDYEGKGLKSFALDKTGPLPRVGYLAVGDKFTVNAACYNDADYTTLDALKGAYAGISANVPGYWELSKAAPSKGVTAKVIEVTTMPDGQPGVKLQIIKA